MFEVFVLVFIVPAETGTSLGKVSHTYGVLHISGLRFSITNEGCCKENLLPIPQDYLLVASLLEVAQ